jgi:carboxypeptidase C (cathepsin A)
MRLPNWTMFIALLLTWHGAAAQTRGATGETARPAPPALHRLPADSTTHHSVELPGRTLSFSVTAGSVTLTNADGVAEAQVAYLAYVLDTPPGSTVPRPISFAFNGGPGAVSDTIHLGLLGPWRIPMDPAHARPSASAAVSANADTWLDFTDLVFLDPVGTGFSRLLVNTEETRKKYWSVNGDVESLATTIRQYLAAAHRMTAPKYIIGESYGGLRGPRLVRELSANQSVGVSGLILVSPELDSGGYSEALDTMGAVSVLPTLVASARARKGPVTRADMADVEAYAAGDYLLDLVRGEADPQALARRIDHLSALTGIDRGYWVRRHGKTYSFDFFRQRLPDQMASRYDSSLEKPDPFPEYVNEFPFDSLSSALDAPLGSAMLDLYGRQFHWLPDGPYVQNNYRAERAWDFMVRGARAESVSALRTELALDPGFHVLIGHGLFDFATPYFRTQLLLNQIPPSVGTDRIAFQVYAGGHMFYTHEENRAPFRAAARALYDMQ